MLLSTEVAIPKKKSSSFKGALMSSGVMAFAGLGDALLYPVLPVYGESMGFSVFFIGVLLSVNRFIRIIANTHIANIVNRIGMKRVLVISSMFAVITTSLYGLKLGLISFLIARILWGLSYSGLKISTLNYASIVKKKSGLTYGLSQSIKSLGALFVLWFGPIVIGSFGTEKGILIIALISSISILFAISLPSNFAPPQQTKVRTRKTFYPSASNLLVFFMSIAIDGILVVTLSELLKISFSDLNQLLVTVAFYLLLKKFFVTVFSMISAIISLKV